MRCSKCASDNREGRKFCANCGAPLAVTCAKCGASNQPDEKFCGECGAGLAEASTKPPEVKPIVAAAGGERRHLTVLFCDLVGSTEIAAQLDPEEWRELVAGYHRTAAEAITRFTGHVAKYLGDGVMAYFGWPEAHENDAERAARAGLAILEAVAKLNQESKEPHISVRVGIDSGGVVVGAGAGKDADVFGETPNIAARVQTAAAPNSVLITAATHRLLSGLFVVERSGGQQLKGMVAPVELYRVVRPTGVRSRIAVRDLTPFVGRNEELSLLFNRWEHACEGEGQAVLVIGEAGMGKSRLVAEFHNRIRDTPHIWMESAGEQFFENTPFHAVREMLSRWLELQSGGDREEQFEKLERALESAGLKVEETAPLIGELLQLPEGERYPQLKLTPEEKRRRLLSALAAWAFGAARLQPVVMVVEDLHWLDPSTLDLQQLLVEQGATVPLMLLYTARPEFRTPWPLRAHHTQITLNRLSTRNVREMIAQVAARTALADETVDAVVARTSGVPLFVEELTRAVLESGTTNSRAREIPATLHDSLMARLDRLGPAKEVVQIGAVIGPEFSYELLHAVHPLSERDLQGALRSATDAELIYARGLAPDAIYQFKHALIRDAAYEALLKSRRRKLHRRVAQTIDEQFDAIKEAHPEVLARHWTEAGETDVAIPLWSKIGDAARLRCAFAEAHGAYQNALALLELLPQSREREERELSIQTALTTVLQITRGYSAPQTIEASARARALSEKVGNLAQLTLQALNRWAALSSGGDFMAASRIAENMFDFASRDGEALSLAYAHMALMTSRYRLGDLVGAEHYFICGRTLFDSEAFRRTPGAIPQTFGNASQVALLMGRADTARDRIRQAISSVLNSDSPYDQAFAQSMAAMLQLLLGEPKQARDSATRSLELCDKHKFPQFGALSRIALGRARAELGDVRKGVELIRQGVAETLATRNRNAMSVCLHWLSEAQMFGGKISEAIGSVEQAINVDPPQPHFRPENLWHRGELRLKQGDIKLAETDFRESLALAQKMRAKLWELHSTMSLARLLASQDRGEEARSMLTEIYNWFTEGFDTADLKEAKALLDELSA